VKEGILTRTRNGAALPLSRVPASDFDSFRGALLGELAAGRRLVAFFAAPEPGVAAALWAVLADDGPGKLAVARTVLSDDRFPSLTPAAPQAHLFEREMAEQLGLKPQGHPWLKPVRYRPTWRPGHDAWGRKDGEPIPPAVGDFFRVEGDEVHEVAVGPVHAGVIEPGHFRFQCHGERVLHLEIALGFQHRGVEESLLGGPHRTTVARVETLAGDTTVGHATAYAHAVEALSGTSVPPRAQSIRGIARELERLANHAGDLGALAGDVGFLPTASFCGRLRGDFLNMTALLSGNRFGRGLVRPGGTLVDLDETMAEELRRRLLETMKDLRGAAELLFGAATVTARFEGAGRVDPATAESLGLVGPAARACGVDQDVRRDHPTGIYRFCHVPVMTAHDGDVHSRAFVRWLEAQRSFDFVIAQLAALPKSGVRAVEKPIRPDHVVVSLVEGWRGEVCHVAITGVDGRFSRYKVVDPSFHNWFGLAMALRNEEISDFPLCNKSFNLSYCGHDL
jgi:Ni,Fe-hydrogenase III large subunit